VLKTTTLTLIALFVCASATTLATGGKPTSGRTTIKGVNYYYELHGKGGTPLLMLHGGLMSTDSFDAIVPRFTEARQVILVDLEGHGRTTLGNRSIRCEAIADDLDTLLGQLGRAQVDVLGHSFGACVGLRLAVQHPERVRRLVVVSVTFANDGWYPNLREQHKTMKWSDALLPMMAETPMYKTYKAVAPKPGDFPRLFDAMGEFMRNKYDWSSDVSKLKMPVILVFGDADMIRPEHELKFYQLLGGGLRDVGWNRENMPQNRLAILPDVTHYESGSSPRMVEAVLPFLDGRSDAKGGAGQAKSLPAKK
jgi:pimeloyl-ACP methyl ester carboxylesterase